jgi:aldehyde dehydrogenase (NAD+)
MMRPLLPAGISLRHPGRCFIGGKWTAPAQDAMIAVVSPDDETVVARVAEARESEIDAAVASARHAFDHGPWPSLTGAERLE